MKNKRIIDIIYNISHQLFRYGANNINAIVSICSCLNRIMWEMKFQNIDDILQFPDYEIEKILRTADTKIDFSIFYKMQSEKGMHYVISDFKKLLKENRKNIANSIQLIIDELGNKLGLLITDKFSIKIMQEFAKQMQNNGFVIDPCCGTGRLLSGFDNYKTSGFEINNEISIIAQTYLNLLSSESDYKNLATNVKNEDYLYENLDPNYHFHPATYIFDPPLHVQLELLGDLHYQLNSHGIYSLNNNIFSEYAFLAKILFGQENANVNFICIFTNNFLFNQSKFVTSFRRYLMNNSLIAVIQSNFSENNKIQKLILVGKNRLDNPHNGLRYFITPKDKNISEDDISRIVQKCLNNETFDEKEFYNIAKIKAYTLQEIRENDYLISMPQYFEDEINPNEIKSLTEIVDDLKTSNQNLIQTSDDLEKLTQNLLNGIKNIQESDIEVPDILLKAEENFWFEKENSDVAKAIRSFKNKEEGWTRIEIKLNLDNLTNEIENIKILYKENRLRIKNNYFEINTRKNIKAQNDKTLFETLIKTTEQDNYWKNITEYLAPRQIKIFEEFIKFYFEDLKGDKKYFTDFTTSEIHSTIGTLKALGLLKYRADIDDIYERYFPYVSLLNIEEEF